MTTTDCTPLAERIAREHAPAQRGPWLICACDRGNGVREHYSRMQHVEHIATVTERAVRERIASALEGERDKPLPLAGESNARSEGVHYGLNRAARIVRGGTR